MDEQTQITTTDGAMTALVARPTSETRGAVVVVMEAFGLNAHIADVAARFAAEGYAALAPDLYHRQGALRVAAYDDLPEAMGLFSSLDTASLGDDLAATVAAARELASGGPVAVVGFCLGGYAAVLAGIRSSPDVVAGFYGAGMSMPRDGSPLEPLAAGFREIGCPVYLFYGADDPVIPPDEIAATEAALTAAGVTHEVTVYPGAGHGFFCDARTSYTPEAAADAWAKVLAALAAAKPAEATA